LDEQEQVCGGPVPARDLRGGFAHAGLPRQPSGSRFEVEPAKICDDASDAACLVVSGECQALPVLRPDREQHKAEFVVAVIVIDLIPAWVLGRAQIRPDIGPALASRSKRST